MQFLTAETVGVQKSRKFVLCLVCRTVAEFLARNAQCISSATGTKGSAVSQRKVKEGSKGVSLALEVRLTSELLSSDRERAVIVDD